MSPSSLLPSYQNLKARYEAANQGHLLSFYSSLPPSEQDSLLQQLADLDVERVNRIYTKAIESEQGLTPNHSPRLKKSTLVETGTLERVRRERSESLSEREGASALEGRINGLSLSEFGSKPTPATITTQDKVAEVKEVAESFGTKLLNGVGALVGTITGSSSSPPSPPTDGHSSSSPVKPSIDESNGLLTTPSTAPPPHHDESDDIEPLPASCAASVLTSPSLTAAWRRTGLEAISRSQVAVLLMAGGQGTRLGSSAPKGCFDIGLPSSKTLFQYQAERIRRLEEVAKKEVGGEQGEKATITWFVMTSGPTRVETEAFFREKDFFGLQEKDVVFFEQGVLPCLSESGKILLSSTSSIALAPDGNGGVYSALRRPISPTDSRTVISIIEDRKIEYIHAYGVDNCLVRVADPTFVGYCITQKAECGAKVVPKTVPTESVGVVARKGGAFGVVEYTELPKAKAEQRDANGELSFRAANIANHFYTTAFLNEIDSFEPLMAFHIARKKIPTVDLTSGDAVSPSTPNGMKLEMFVFDVFPFTETLAVLEVERVEEFSPLKNGKGSTSDNQETSKRDLLAQQKRWIEAVGATVETKEEVEISPLVSYAGEGLDALKGFVFRKGGVVESLEKEALVSFA